MLYLFNSFKMVSTFSLTAMYIDTELVLFYLLR